jgi:hypothetical protein
LACEDNGKTIHGCFDSQACNYNPLANIDNNSCIYKIDCKGDCGGTAQVDSCDVCVGGNTGEVACDDDAADCTSISVDTSRGECGITLEYDGQVAFSIGGENV